MARITVDTSTVYLALDVDPTDLRNASYAIEELLDAIARLKATRAHGAVTITLQEKEED